MSDSVSPAATRPFPGEGEMVRAVNAKDWGATLLGPVPCWPASIRTAVSLSLNTDFQMLVLSGPEFVYIYNDASIPIFGDKHPWALGQRVEDVWPEVWHTLQPMLVSVLETGKATSHEDLLLALHRAGFAEECYFTLSYSPIIEDGGAIVGVLVTTMETTGRVLSERRRRTLAELATAVARGGPDGRSLDQVRQALAGNPFDLPLTALYLVDEDDARAAHAFCTGLRPGSPGLAASLAWPAGGEHPLAPLAQSGEPLLFDAAALLDEASACGVWPEQPRQMMALPLMAPGQARPRGFLLSAVNPRAPLGNAYCDFLEAAAGLVAIALANADAVDAERRRVQAMAELDRSKSQFFANASHELRTPVTLILGPLTELAEHPGAPPQEARDYVELAYRNAKRLHKLVNAIMDFASIEAGRVELAPEPLDVAELTAELLGLFRSATEAAGLRLSFASSLPPARILLDRGMWEKVVVNLLSNAYKFTPAGSIDVALERSGALFRLTVRDTGIGIGPEHLPRIFERFYRGAPETARRSEGSGIGLALVQELVRLHGGEVGVQSLAGAGTTFTVTMPWNEADAAMPAAASGAALRLADWEDAGAVLPASRPAPAGEAGPISVVVVDDNHDIVRYIERVLAGSCAVVAAPDAAAGLAAVRATRPDLVLVDVMMPGPSGLELVRAIRADPSVLTVSVVVLSARGGADARLDALAAGADDFLDKPFTGRELLARVNSNVRLARIRRAAIEQESELKRQVAAARDDLANVLEGTSDAFVSLDRALRVVSLNLAAAVAFGRSVEEAAGRSVFELEPSLCGTELDAALHAAVQAGQPGLVEHFHPPTQRWYSVRVLPARHGAVAFGEDITARKQAEHALMLANSELERRVAERTSELREATRLLAAVFDRAPGGIAILGTDGAYVRVNPAYEALLGYPEAQLSGRRIAGLVEPQDYPEAEDHLRRLVSGEAQHCQCELRYHRADGRVVWLHNFMSVIEDEQQQARYFVQIAKDVTQRRLAEAERHAAQEELKELYQRLQTVREEERTALAREVHDQLGQVLSAAKIDLRLLEDDLLAQGASLPPARIVEELRSASGTLDRAVDLVRAIATELRAPSLDGQGLYAAIAWHARDFERRTRIPVTIEVAACLPQPQRPAAEALLRIFQEAMTNVLRHAHAGGVWVCLERRAGKLLLRVRDDGVGIARLRRHAAASLGMTGMRERAMLVGGRFTAGPVQPRGTLVSALVPMQSTTEARAASAAAAEPKEK